MPDLTKQQFLDYLEQAEKEASSGGGYVLNAKFEMGYKAFITGTSNEASWFPFNPGEEGASKSTSVRCKSFMIDNGSNKRPQLSYGFIWDKDSVLGREVSWSEDRYNIYPLWTDAAREIIKPAMIELGILSHGMEFWSRWSWQDDPSGTTELDQEGKEKVKSIAYPVEVFGSREEAEAAAASGGSGGGGSAAEPPLWLVEEVRNWMAGVSDNMPAAVLAKKVEVDSEKAEAFLAGNDDERAAILAEEYAQDEKLVKAAMG